MTPPPGEETQGDSLEPDFAAWSFWEIASEDARADQQRRLADLRARGYLLGDRAMVSRLAAVHPERLYLGDRSYIAAHAHVSGDVSIGDDCSVNVGAVVRGNVSTGRAVRIGSYAALLGFNHGFESIDTEMFTQPLTADGIVVGDDVWIGGHAIVLDGVTIGSHAVVGAGAVVTRDVPAWAVVVGNPARVVRDRRGAEDVLALGLQAFAGRARADSRGILARAWDGEAYRDHAAAAPTVRARCDAIEIATLLADASLLADRDHGGELKRLQDAVLGLVPEFGEDVQAPPPGELPDQTSSYHVLSVGYALDLLQESFPHPVAAIVGLDADGLGQALARLPLADDGWSAGALIDAVGTAITWSARAGAPEASPVAPPTDGLLEVVLGFVTSRRNPETGLVARGPTLRDAVNGTYRALRGTTAQWDERRADPLLATTVADYEAGLDWSTANACDALDVVWLLWWARGDECLRNRSRSVARTVIDLTLAAWQPEGGLPFEPGGPATLQGTEMWLATLWYAADLMNIADALGYRPAGVHRPGPALRWSQPDRRWRAT
ncbi:DapH/DapD/GlmU-related protein [Demequina lutea]|uniref:Acetyltransferase-like isoleucine patch superfamily enzyme n=1 Tax=Demequina lutea TaxID=431489 RepID=A0A7Y9ZC62_9MICO|nr:acyltransferase [Demequina lutea]NYI42170.1 acetyltransferase-like isoleucine patch superfamily enzyme [Demequina lutea]